MNEHTRNQIVAKLGTMQFANAELAGENVLLRELATKQVAKIRELESQVGSLTANNEALAAKMQLMVESRVENLPANSYEQEVKH
jgi:hypothetical protein